MDIRYITDAAAIEAAGHLFDNPPKPAATERFLAEAGHHLFIAYVDGFPAGMISGVETTHPDKGTEMFLYELGVDERYRRQGIGKSLLAALSELARERGCYGMWVATDEDNVAAHATYGRDGAVLEKDQAVFVWTFDAAPQ
jgi:ribosomal protein S18 acetylase RimI-like enzyme